MDKIPEGEPFSVPCSECGMKVLHAPGQPVKDPTICFVCNREKSMRYVGEKIFIFSNEDGGVLKAWRGTARHVEGWYKTAKKTGYVHHIEPGHRARSEKVHSCWVARIEKGWDQTLFDRELDEEKEE